MKTFKNRKENSKPRKISATYSQTNDQITLVEKKLLEIKNKRAVNPVKTGQRI